MTNLTNEIKRTLANYIYNFSGYKTRRKIIVFESDDWGSERTPDKNVFDKLLKAGLKVDNCPFSKYDTIESNNDITDLYSILSKYKDKNGNPAVITANFNLANPDYIKIKNDVYQNYYHINYEQTLSKYPGRENVISLVKEGIKNRLFFPQYHSREHLSPSIWLDEIRNGNKGLITGFKYDVFGLSRATSPDIVKFHLASMLFRNKEEKEGIKESLVQGYNYFDKLFGFKPQSFIAPVYTWNEIIEKQLYDLNIKYIQSSFYQNYYTPYNINSFKRKFRKMGQLNSLGQLYTVRNCIFEPSITPKRDNIGDCLTAIKAAFTMNTPAIVSTHRLNFVGGVDESNRTNNLEMFDKLLTSIVKIWPDAEFMNSVELAKMISDEKSS